MNILLPTDFSENALNAIMYAYRHFDLDKVKINLIHVIEEPRSTSNVLLRLDNIMMKDAEREMHKVQAEIESEFGQKPEYIIKYGHLKNWVEILSNTLQIDLIIMGTKGENDISSKLMGSVTESIIRTSKVPTLAIPSTPFTRDIREFVLATNKKQLEKASFFESLFRVIKLTIPHINILTVLNSEDGNVPKSVPLNGYQIGVKTIKHKDVVDGINSYLETNKVDLLALYHSRNSRLDYLFNRSITKTICAKIQVPLLVIPIAS